MRPGPMRARMNRQARLEAQAHKMHSTGVMNWGGVQMLESVLAQVAMQTNHYAASRRDQPKLDYTVSD